MDIDLIAGLVKPKIALTALPVPENPAPLEGAIPDFTALLDGAKPDTLENSDATAEPEMPATVSVALPELTAPDKAGKPEAKTAEPAEAGPEVQIVPAVITTTSATAPLSKAGMALRAEPANQAQPAIRAPFVFKPETPAKITTEPSLAAHVSKPEPAPAPLVNPGSRMVPDMWVNRDVVETMPAIAALASPAEHVAMAAVNPALPFDKAIVSPVKTPIAPILEARSMPVKTTVNTAVQVSAQPGPVVGFTNIEAVVEDPAEMQFAIKIDRQAVESAPISRQTQHAAPVASQISTQLPQLLTKAEKQTVELRLDPPELGRVTIHLSTNDTQVTAQVVAERVDTIELMRRHAELLSATLARAGFSEADLSFQQGHAQDGEEEIEQFQSITGHSESDTSPVSAPTLAGQDGRLDIRL